MTFTVSWLGYTFITENHFKNVIFERLTRTQVTICHYYFKGLDIEAQKGSVTYLKTKSLQVTETGLIASTPVGGIQMSSKSVKLTQFEKNYIVGIYLKMWENVHHTIEKEDDY